MCQIFLVQVLFWGSERMELDSCVHVIKIFLNLNSQGTFLPRDPQFSELGKWNFITDNEY